jgi:hypothetical protein
MNTGFKLAVSVVGAVALSGSVLTGAFARVPGPFHTLERSQAKRYSVNGDLTVAHVLRVNSNTNIYGNTYARGKAEVWKGLTVRSGGIKSDTLMLTGQLQAQSAVIATNLQAGAITGTTISLTGAASVGGALSVTGKIAGNGVDAGAGGLTTTGSATVGGLTASSITDSGELAAGSIATNGTLTAGATTLSGLTVTGNVDFTKATVTGLNLSGFLQNGATLPTLQVGATSASTAPLAVVENGKSAALGVNSSGALTTSGDLAVGGNFSVAGSFSPGTLTTGNVVSPPASGQTTPGGSALNIQGSGINLTGNTTLAAGSDLIMSAPTTGSASHIAANGDFDLAGSTQLAVPGNVGAGYDATKSVKFAQAYGNAPIVVVTPAQDPVPGINQGAPYWVTTTTTDFTIHYKTVAANSGNGFNLTFYYHVFGQ